MWFTRRSYWSDAQRTTATVTRRRGVKHVNGQDIDEHGWVDEWLWDQPFGSQRWAARDWKQYFIRLARTLSYILRHGANEQNLMIRRDGCIPVTVLLNHNRFKEFGYIKTDVKVVVARDVKQRFALKREGDAPLIYAQQGHSSKVGDIDQRTLHAILLEASIPDCVIHGTVRTNLTAILTAGLKKMGRDHIHMVAEMPNAEVKSRVRKGSNTILKIDVRTAIADGIEFLLSGNGIILTGGINGVLPPKYITCVMDQHGRLMDRPIRFPIVVNWPNDSFENEAVSPSIVSQQRATSPRGAPLRKLQ